MSDALFLEDTLMSTTAEDTASITRADAWEGFAGDRWREEIDVRDFIQSNYPPYEGDDGFLAGPTARTTRLWEKLLELFKEERERGVLDVSPEVGAGITTHAKHPEAARKLLEGLG